MYSNCLLFCANSWSSAFVCEANFSAASFSSFKAFTLSSNALQFELDTNPSNCWFFLAKSFTFSWSSAIVSFAFKLNDSFSFINKAFAFKSRFQSFNIFLLNDTCSIFSPSNFLFFSTNILFSSTIDLYLLESSPAKR